MIKDTNHEKEVQRLAQLLRNIADDIEDNPNRITWREDYDFGQCEVSQLDIDLSYRGDLELIRSEFEKMDQ